MPLHLLGKKSWNVYNTDNIERVRRDEADAREREEAAEQRMQEQDAERRMALLRGEKPPDLPPPEEPAEDVHGHKRRDDGVVTHERKRRKLKGEDETDREMRYAREDAEAGDRARETMRAASRKGDDAPLQDHAGHIQLVSGPDERAPRNAEATKGEKTQARKKEDEEGHCMRFSDAAGYRKGTHKPWYATSDTRGREDDSRSTSELVLAEVQGRDVWGNEDPRRKERERNRIVSNDPFAMMQQAQRQLKQSEGDREKWRQEREKEVREQRREDERRRRHERKHDARRHRRREEEKDDLEGFSLDGPAKESRSHRSDSDRHRRHRHSRRRSRSRSRERRRT